LHEAVGWLVVLGFGIMFTVVTVFLSRYEYRILGTEQSSEQFNTAGRDIGPGLTAAVIVSQWTWAATLLMSSNMGFTVGISGPFWYASGATVQILLFAVLAIQVKRRCSHMHTFMEIVKARFGTGPHLVMMFFALLTNVIVTSMLLLGGAWTIEDLTGVNKLFAAFIIPLVSCWIYTMFGGLRATFLASYIHTTVIFFMLIVFSFAVYTGTGDEAPGVGPLWGSASNVHKALQAATQYGFQQATFTESHIMNNMADYDQGRLFHGMGAIMQNAGICYKKSTEGWTATDKYCGYTARSKSEPCCAQLDFDFLKDATYCRKDENSDCISIGPKKHFESTECGQDETCVTSFATMSSTIGLIFGITNIVGNFGTVFVDQSYWQSAVAAKPSSAVLGFLIGGMVWFGVPFCMATSNGLAGRALTMHPDINGAHGSYYISSGDSGGGLTPARVLTHVMGGFGSFILLLQLFMAITSTGSAEIIAVSSILTYDVYYEYLNPELKSRRLKLRSIFYSVIQGFTGSGTGDAVEVEEAQRLELAMKAIPLESVQGVMDRLSQRGFFEVAPTSTELEKLGKLLAAIATSEGVVVSDLYSAVNKAVSSNNIEGKILLRVSKFFTGIFALFMGFIAVFLLASPVDSLGHVYMSMGVLVGSAVGPAALTILMERANGTAVAAGAIGGFIMGVSSWVIRAAAEFDEVDYGTMMSDWPWVVGNVCAIGGGTAIALAGSLMFPDNNFRWSMLNDRIPLVDDVEPPKDEKDSDAKLQFQVKIAIIASVALTFILLILWPLPLHGAGVFSEGSFSFWVPLQFLWAIIGGAVIIILPGYELVMTFMGKNKTIETNTAVDIKIVVNNDAAPKEVK
jgi:Na+/proline symporter